MIPGVILLARKEVGNPQSCHKVFFLQKQITMSGRIGRIIKLASSKGIIHYCNDDEEDVNGRQAREKEVERVSHFATSQHDDRDNVPQNSKNANNCLTNVKD